MPKVSIGLDIGGTKIQGIVWDGKSVVKEIVVPTPHNLQAFKHRVLSILKQLSLVNEPVSVGIGVAGLVDKKRGVIKNSPNLKFLKNFTIKKFLNLNGFKEVSVDNDVACFTLAELRLGSGKKYKNFLCMTLGTGVGGGIVINSVPYRGFENFGAEFGSTIVENGKLEPQFQEARQRKDYQLIGNLVGQACVNLINIFNPQAIILGGGVSAHFKDFHQSMKKVLKENLNPYTVKTPVTVSKIKNAGSIGAVLLNY